MYEMLAAAALDANDPDRVVEAVLRARERHPDLSAEELRQTKDWIVSQVPMKRFGQPEEIAAAVLYLTSPESGFVIGADLIIDGGMETLS